MADAPDSKSGDGDIVRVQVPPPALFESRVFNAAFFLRLFFEIEVLLIYN